MLAWKDDKVFEMMQRAIDFKSLWPEWDNPGSTHWALADL